MDRPIHTDLLLRLSLRLDPARPPEFWPPRPPPMTPRPDAGVDPAGVRAALRTAGFRPVGLDLDGAEARIAVEGGRYATLAQVAGRVARAVQPLLPAPVERLRIEWFRQGVQVAQLVLPREALEAAARGHGSAEEVLAAAHLLPADGTTPELGIGWSVAPRIALQLGDPRVGVRWQAGIGAGLRVGLGEGFALVGGIGQTVAGNLDRGLPSNSLLPHVRTDVARYAREGKTSIPARYAERIWTPAPDWFARVTGGLLEPMFMGVSGEVLWRPVDRPYAVGLDLNWVAQREYRQRFGALGYSTGTGHLSLYADLPVWNLYTVLRGGRYLAGDWGGTVELGRRFDSGIEVGGYATLTNVSARQFGEGSFDKGIYVRFPLQLLGPETGSRATAVIRPVVRDGGHRLAVDNPLWEVARDGRAEALGRGYQGFLR